MTGAVAAALVSTGAGELADGESSSLPPHAAKASAASRSTGKPKTFRIAPQNTLVPVEVIYAGLHDAYPAGCDNETMNGTRLVLIMVGGAAAFVVFFQIANMLSEY